MNPGPRPRKDKRLRPIDSDDDLDSVGKDGASVAPSTAKRSRDDVMRASDGAYIGLAKGLRPALPARAEAVGVGGAPAPHGRRSRVRPDLLERFLASKVYEAYGRRDLDADQVDDVPAASEAPAPPVAGAPLPCGSCRG